MQYIDQHMHSKYSFDSNAQFEDYLNVTDNYIVTTDHLDLCEPSIGYKDRELDLSDYLITVEELNKEYRNRVFKGVESGWISSQHNRIVDILTSIDYDLVLLSLHSNTKYNYMDRNAGITKDPSLLVPEYLNALIEAVDAMHSHVQVLAHFDYGFRITPVTVEELKKYGETILINLFNKMIEYNISFEINTSSMFKYENLHLYEYAVSLYIQCGGKSFTMGSDAHRVEDYQFMFPETIVLLDKWGVIYLNHYVNKKPYKTEVKRLLKQI